MIYSVVVEVRQQGALGVFSLARFTVDAASEQEAREFAMGEAWNAGMETRAVWRPEVKGE
jgi:purine nucleoside permease